MHTDVPISPTTVLLVYGALLIIVSLAGGWIPMMLRLTHTGMQISSSLVAGLMLGVGVLHMVPHAYTQMKSMDGVAQWLLIGFLVVFFVQRFFHFHHHDVPEIPENAHQHLHDEKGNCHCRNHEPASCGNSLAEQSARRLSWAGATVGMLIHTVFDGFAVAANVQAEALHGCSSGFFLGLGAFLVVFLHKPFESMAIVTLMKRDGSSSTIRHLVNALIALGIVGGMAACYWGGMLSGSQSYYLGAAMAFSAGTFLCIATGDLLPELQFHSHDRWKMSIALLAGVGLSIMVGAFETTGHDEDHSEEAPAAAVQGTNVNPHAGHDHAQ